MDFVPESLKDECLNVILENFERFYGAFKLSQGSVLGKHFEYLERAFSETLFHKLLSACKLEEKYFEFLINPHVRRLNLEGINEDLMPALVKQLNMIESSVTFLRASHLWNIEVDCYKQLISAVPKVEIIEISDVVNPQVLLEEIGKRCPLLRVLKIKNCDIDDVGLMGIFMNVNGEYETKVHLEQLDLSSALADSDGIMFVLSHAPSLKCLDHCNVPKALYEKHKGDLENNSVENSKKYSLTNLSFPSWEKNVLDTLKICTRFCPSVTSISIDCLENDEQLILCAKFHHLKDLKVNVHTNTISFDGMTQFLKLRGRSLFSVQLEYGCVSAESIVEHCPKLRSLGLSAVGFQPLDNKNKHLFSRAKLSNLKTLSVTGSDFSVKEAVDSVKLILSNTKSLNSVSFSGCEGLTQDFLHSLFDFGLLQVHEMNLTSSDVTVPPITDLLARGSLQKLSVAKCVNITEMDFFDLLVSRGNCEISMTLSTSDDEESFGFDFDDYDEYDVYNDYGDVYDDYEFDVYDGYDFDFDHGYCDYDVDYQDDDCYYDNYYDADCYDTDHS